MKSLSLLFSLSILFNLASGQTGTINGFENRPVEAMDTIPYADERNEVSTNIEAYIPNIFSPNGDGVNDFFQIYTANGNNLMITRFFIFDRWGINVYERYNLPIHSSDGWWDGTLKRFTLNPGAFSYYIELENKSGERKTFKGTVTLVR